MLGQGFGVASSSLNVFGNNCNDLTASETMMMVKERFVEAYTWALDSLHRHGARATLESLVRERSDGESG